MTIFYEGDQRYCGLPKWPAIIVVGDPVTPDQAAEIILRTDYHIPDTWGNDKGLARQISELFGVPPEPSYPGKDASERAKADNMRRNRARWNGIERLQTDLGCIPLEYLGNDRVMSSYIGGANGWCNWDGTIGMRDKNIGKWPDSDTVAEEWQRIHNAFPFLNLRCQLFNAEYCEDDPRPVVHYIVRDGDVVVRPSNGVVLEPPPYQTLKSTDYPTRGGIGTSYQLRIQSLRAKLELIYDGNIPQYKEMPDDE